MSLIGNAPRPGPTPTALTITFPAGLQLPQRVAGALSGMLWLISVPPPPPICHRSYYTAEPSARPPQTLPCASSGRRTQIERGAPFITSLRTENRRLR